MMIYGNMRALGLAALYQKFKKDGLRNPQLIVVGVSLLGMALLLAFQYFQ